MTKCQRNRSDSLRYRKRWVPFGQSGAVADCPQNLVLFLQSASLRRKYFFRRSDWRKSGRRASRVSQQSPTGGDRHACALAWPLARKRSWVRQVMIAVHAVGCGSTPAREQDKHAFLRRPLVIRHGCQGIIPSCCAITLYIASIISTDEVSSAAAPTSGGNSAMRHTEARTR